MAAEHTGWKPVPHVLPYADNPLDAGLVRAAFRGGDDCPGGAPCLHDLGCNGPTACRACTTWVATDRRRTVPARPRLRGAINPVDVWIVQSLFGTCEPPRDVCP
jgi:hypothetical protein